jgi:hypothetical protein
MFSRGACVLAALTPLLAVSSGCFGRPVPALGPETAPQLSYTILHRPPRPLRPIARLSVDVFLTAPRRSFVEYALIETMQFEVGETTGVVIERMRTLAGQIGCNGVVILGRNDEAPSAQFWGSRKGFIAACIVWSDEPRAP